MPKANNIRKSLEDITGLLERIFLILNFLIFGNLVNFWNFSFIEIIPRKVNATIF